MSDTPVQRLIAGLRAEASFVATVARRFASERILVAAASLSYTSLLALVPLIAISFSVLTAFPAFDGIAARIIGLILTYAAPGSDDQVATYLDQFASNTRSLTGLGIVWLAVTAIMLLSTIEAAFNAIWRVEVPRAIAMRLVAYWTALTLGPFLIGAGLSLSTAVFAMRNVSALGVDLSGAREGVLMLLPFLLAVAAFSVLYIALPNRRVPWRNAVLGAAVAAALFEALKAGFGLYITHAGTFENVYGSLAAIPVFLIWTYLAWAVVLFGAVVASTRPEWLASRRARDFGPMTPARCLLRALQAMEAMRTAARDRRMMDEATLLEAVNGDGAGLGQALTRLQEAGFVARTEEDCPVLMRDLDGVTVADIYDALGHAPGELPRDDARWAAALSTLLQEFRSARHRAMDEPVTSLLDRLAVPSGSRVIQARPDPVKA